MPQLSASCAVEVILGNSNPRFSGVTSTLLQTLDYQQDQLHLRVLGAHFLPNPELAISFIEAIKLCSTPLPDGRWRVFHARRNNEMLQALVLKKIFRAKLLILFTSTAQRHHSRFTRWLMRKMDAVISTCEAAAAYLKIPCAQIIPHGIRTHDYFPAINRAADWQALGMPGHYGIGIFGRVRAQKGIHHLVRACIELFPSHPEFSLVIVGGIAPQDAAYVAALKSEVASQQLERRIQFLGEQEFARIPVLFRAMSLVCALSKQEGFGLTVLEAMASGAAVLATRAGAWPEIIRDGVDGYCVPADDYTAIRDKLASLLAAPEHLVTMGNNGTERVRQHYRIEREAQQLCDFYRQLQERDLQRRSAT